MSHGGASMIVRALIAVAWCVPPVALAAQAKRPPVDFDKLPALGKEIEAGSEKDYRFRTYLVGKRPTSTGVITIFVGEIHMRVQDISGGNTQRAPYVRKWKYAARCSGAPNTIGVWTESIAPREKGGMLYSVTPGVRPDSADLTGYNVWYAVCLDDFNKYPRNRD